MTSPMPQGSDPAPAGSPESGNRLPRSLYPPRKDPRKELRETVDAILSDGFMAVLSLFLIPLILLPILFSFPASTLLLFQTGDAIIVIFFVVEYVAKLYLAESSWEYFRNPWHLLDLTVIVLSFVSYLPFLALGSKGSSLLLVRLVRLTRVLTVGGRAASSRIHVATAEGGTDSLRPSPRVQVVRSGPSPVRETLSWEGVEAHLATNAPEWIDFSNLTEAEVMRLAALLRVRHHHFRLHQLNDLHPHAREADRRSFIYLQVKKVRYPERSEELFKIARQGLVLICLGPKILSISPHSTDLVERVLPILEEDHMSRAFVAAVLRGILAANLDEYRTIFNDIDAEVSVISGIPRSKLPRDFLPRMYQLSKASSRLAANLGHFKELIDRVLSGKIALDGLETEGHGRFEALVDESHYLELVSQDVLDNLHSLIDVYINQSSFDTNRVLKVLAVITAIAIIPSTIGGLLGIDGPYDFILWQVLLATVLSMVFALYCFLKLGWLRV